MSEAETSPITVRFECTDAERALAGELLAGRTPKNTLGPDGELPWLQRGLAGSVLFIGLSLALLWMKGAEAQRHWTSYFGGIGPRVAIATLIIGAACVAMSFIFFRRVRRFSESRWAGQWCWVFDDYGLTVSRPGRTEGFPWSRFSGFEESDTLLVLRDAPNHGITLPKRLFASVDDVNRLRRLLIRYILAPEPSQARGFPVVLR